MADDILVKVDGVSKKFCRSLKKSLWYGMNDMASEVMGAKGSHDLLRTGEFWAIKNVSFELKRGECLGLIGRNGAGKTTLLKMLNGLIKPDHGRIEMRGRIGALIALGAGFSPILTGRENIYVNGSVLGLTKKEIDAKLEEIIDFADIRDFIDSPVQTYSSGMTVRLGFAVAVKLINPEVLILDEVLAVGDEGFRSKCYNAVSRLLNQCAVIFVSHSMPSVHRISTKVMLLTDGQVGYTGDSAKGIEQYHRLFSNEKGGVRRSLGTGEATVHSACLLDERGDRASECEHGRPYRLQFDLTVASEYPEYDMSVTFLTTSQELVAQCHSKYNRQVCKNDGKRHSILITFDEQLLNPGKYTVNLVIFYKQSIRHLCWEIGIITFLVRGIFTGTAPIQLVGNWQTLA